MPLESPESLSRSIRKFLREFIMIVVSITCALALEQTVSSLHHRRSAEQSRRQILQELRSNLAEVQRVAQANEQHARQMNAAYKELLKQALAGVPSQKINDAFVARFDGAALGITLPNLRHGAWDVAVANQSATYIDDASLRNFSVAYASIKDFSSSFGSAIEVTNLPGLTMLITDLQLRRATSLELLRTLSRATTTFQLVKENLTDLGRQLEESTKEPA
jgi:plasmid stability protein